MYAYQNTCTCNQIHCPFTCIDNELKMFHILIEIIRPICRKSCIMICHLVSSVGNGHMTYIHVHVDIFSKRHRRKVPICHLGTDKVTNSTNWNVS